MPPAWFEPAISASEKPQTHALDRAATAMPGFILSAVGLKLFSALVPSLSQLTTHSPTADWVTFQFHYINNPFTRTYKTTGRSVNTICSDTQWSKELNNKAVTIAPVVLSLWIDASYFPSETFVLLKLYNFNLEVCNVLNKLESVI
jgi:hypothetical protein